MKQGILITAYKDFDHLLDLVSFFDTRFGIFIHIDKKSRVENDILDQLYSLPQVHLISRKYKVNWGGHNHLKSILHLSEAALKHTDLDRFHLISGHDYPIKPLTYFIDFFKTNTDKNYFSYFEFPVKQWPHGGKDRIDFYNFYDLLDAKKYRPYLFKIVNLQRDLKIKRPYSKQAPKLYGGDTWWSLNREALQYVIDYTKTKPYLFRRLKYSFCSEELYVHTVLLNSPYALSVVNSSLRYIDWSYRNGNFPANLDLSDLDPVLASDAIFARKFVLPVSDPLKQKLNLILNPNLK